MIDVYNSIESHSRRKDFSDEVSSVSNYLKGQFTQFLVQNQILKLPGRRFEVATKILKEIGRL